MLIIPPERFLVNFMSSFCAKTWRAQRCVSGAIFSSEVKSRWARWPILMGANQSNRAADYALKFIDLRRRPQTVMDPPHQAINRDAVG